MIIDFEDRFRLIDWIVEDRQAIEKILSNKMMHSFAQHNLWLETNDEEKRWSPIKDVLGKEQILKLLFKKREKPTFDLIIEN